MLRSFEELSTRPDAFGYEHEVWFRGGEEESPRVLKATYPNCFGVRPDGGEAAPAEYLARRGLQNQVFGDEIALEGVMEPSFRLFRVVTSQPAVQGRPAQPEEIEHFFSQHGFTRCLWHGKSVWFREVDRIVCSDTHGGNVLVTGRGMVAIDVPVMLAPPDFEVQSA